MVKCFVPKGRSGHYIYAVSLKDHPDVVKIGMTTKWKDRKKTYENWNLRRGDGIDKEMVFVVTQDFVDLAALEKHILENICLPLRHGAEWFHGDFDDVCRRIDRILCAAEIDFDLY